MLPYRANSIYILFITPLRYSGSKLWYEAQMSVLGNIFFTDGKVVFIHLDQVDTHLSFISELTSLVPQGGVWRVYIPSLLFMGAKISVLGLKMSLSPYLRSAMVRFPLSIGLLTKQTRTEKISNDLQQSADTLTV